MLCYHPDIDRVERLTDNSDSRSDQQLVAKQTNTSDQNGSRRLNIVLVIRGVPVAGDDAEGDFPHHRLDDGRDEGVSDNGGDFGCQVPSDSSVQLQPSILFDNCSSIAKEPRPIVHVSAEYDAVAPLRRHRLVPQLNEDRHEPCRVEGGEQDGLGDPRGEAGVHRGLDPREHDSGTAILNDGLHGLGGVGGRYFLQRRDLRLGTHRARGGHLLQQNSEENAREK